MNVFETINSIMKELPAIAKDQKNSSQNFQYRGIDQFMNALNPLMAKHGLFCTPELVQGFPQEQINTKSGGIMFKSIADYKYTFYALDGSSISTIIRGEAMDSGDKGYNKVCAIALKYVLMQLFMVATEDFKDPDEVSHEDVKKTEPAVPVATETKGITPSTAFDQPDNSQFLIDAIDLVNQCPDVKTLTQLYNMRTQLHSNPQFIEAIKARREQLKKGQTELAIA